jgi:hypothetical protein
MVVKRLIQITMLSLLSCLSATALASTQYHLTITCDEGGSAQIMVNSGGTGRSWGGDVSVLLDAGAQVQVSATPDDGWHFVGWLGTVGYSDSTVSFTMDKDWELEAVFDRSGPTLAVTCGKGGKVVQPGVGSFSYNRGTLVTIQAAPDDGYRFSSWTGSAVQAGELGDPNSATTTVAMYGNYTLQANFTVAQHTLTISSGTGGSVTTPGVGSFSYAHGTIVPIGARANAGYHFAAWTGSAVDALKVEDPNAASTTVTINDNYTLKANFASDQHVLTVICDSGGSVQTVASWNGTRTSWTGSGAFVINDGATVQMTATANAGWHFTQWSTSSGATQTTLTFTLTADRTVEAYFAQDARTLAVSSGDGGTVTKPGVGAFSYQRGTSVAIEAVANNGYRFVRWTGSVVDANNVANPRASQTSVTIDASGTLMANFERTPQGFYETWETAAIASITPSKTAVISADAGLWAVRDVVTCVATPNRAEILSSEGDQALKLTSNNSHTSCSDRVSVLLGATDSANLWSGVAIATNTVISFDEVGQLCNPALHSASKGSLILPAYDNISVILIDNNGNTLVYVLQRYPAATANLSAAGSAQTYREILLDPVAIKYQRNLFTDFMTIPAFKPTGATVQSIELRVDAHGSAIFDNLTIGSGTVVQKVPIYRFWSPTSEEHFYTTNSSERQKVNGDPNDWIAEGIAYFALPNGSDPNATPVYRFWSPVRSSHFYTISESEKAKLLTQFKDAWTLEGVFFYGYAEAQRPADAVPVYRFWSAILGEHFYTTYEPERDKVIKMNPAIWVSEGVAWYAYPPWPFASALSDAGCGQ